MIFARLSAYIASGADMIIKLTGGDKRQYGHSIQKMDHNIGATGLFTDSNLVRALDMHPPENIDICTADTFQACERGGLTSFELIEAVKRGALWINLRHLHELSTPHGRLVKHMHKAFARHLGLFTHSRSAGLILSSPGASEGYDVNLTDVALWHLRGRKRVHLYPNQAPFIQPQDVQRLALQAGFEPIPYHPSFDSRAITIDLEPGELMCWAHLAPHRIDNLAGLNVSLSLESLTPQSRARVGAHYFDGYINRKYEKSLETTTLKPMVAYTKAAIAAVLKRSEKTDAEPVQLSPKYRVNLRGSGCLEAI